MCPIGKEVSRTQIYPSQAFPVIVQYLCYDCNNKTLFITPYLIIFQVRLLKLSSTHHYHVVHACTWGFVETTGVTAAMGKFYTNSWDRKMAFALPDWNWEIPYLRPCTLSRNVYMRKCKVVDTNYEETDVIYMVWWSSAKLFLSAASTSQRARQSTCYF